MPITRPSLYEFFAEGRSLYRLAIGLTETLIPGDEPLELVELFEPTTPGYSRTESPDFHDLFPAPVIVPGQLVRLVSRPVDLINNGPSPVNITGVFLACQQSIASAWQLILFAPAVITWRPGMRIRGRMLITSQIYDEVP